MTPRRFDGSGTQVGLMGYAHSTSAAKVFWQVDVVCGRRISFAKGMISAREAEFSPLHWLQLRSSMVFLHVDMSIAGRALLQISSAESNRGIACGIVNPNAAREKEQNLGGKHRGWRACRFLLGVHQVICWLLPPMSERLCKLWGSNPRAVTCSGS